MLKFPFIKFLYSASGILDLQTSLCLTIMRFLIFTQIDFLAMNKKVILMILDGWGISNDPEKSRL